jgi:uncharacterized integral membrane protein
MMGSRGRDRLLWMVGAVALIVIFVLFIRVNDQVVRVDFMIGTIETDLGIAVLLAAAAGFLGGYMVKG